MGHPGAGGLILHFDGTSWTRTVLPDPPQSFKSLFGVTALSPTDVWAVGIWKPNNLCCPRGLVEHWDGTGWSVVPSPDPKPHATLNLEGIAAMSTNVIWATGSTGIEHWDGSSWTVVSAPGGAGAAALSDGTVVVVSGDSILEN